MVSVGGDQTTSSELEDFRSGLYSTFTRWGDALFELADAVLCSPSPVSSVPALSLEPVFRRSHGSLYKALHHGRIDQDALRRLLVEHRPPSWPQVFAVDASTWDRCDAECSPERGYYYSASKHSAGKPIVAGWHYQWITQLDWAADSWTAPLDVTRIAPSVDATTATVEQVRRLVGLLGDTAEVPLFVFDAGYDPIAISHDLAGLRCETLTRIRDDRVFYQDPVVARSHTGRSTQTGGRPRCHGKQFKCADPATWPKPDATLATSDRRYGNITVQAWHGLHPKLGRHGHWAGHDTLPVVRGTVIRVEVEHLPKPTSRTKKTLWLWWKGPGEPDLDRCWRAYLRRFDIEHTFRFKKGTLGWTTPSLCTPDQADRWSWLIAAAYTQLLLARRLVEDLRLPWERRRQHDALTPTRVRRGFRRLGATIGTPASPPKSTKPGPGRPKGTRKPPRKRYPAIKKAPKTP